MRVWCPPPRVQATALPVPDRAIASPAGTNHVITIVGYMYNRLRRVRGVVRPGYHELVSVLSGLDSQLGFDSAPRPGVTVVTSYQSALICR